jgi:hypothetical protein
MTIVNPFADEPARARAFEQGYLAGYAQPDQEHFPPLEAELLDIFGQGEQAGRNDRGTEFSTQDPLPTEETPDFSRFESAPDGRLIPVPDQYPPGTAIRDDAQITVSVSGSGFYVAIFNGPPEAAGELSHLIGEVLTEAAITRLEHMLAESAAAGAKGLIKFGGLFVSVAISVLTPSPILQETRFRGYLPDQTAIAYVVLTPQH